MLGNRIWECLCQVREMVIWRSVVVVVGVIGVMWWDLLVGDLADHVDHVGQVVLLWCWVFRVWTLGVQSASVECLLLLMTQTWCWS